MKILHHPCDSTLMIYAAGSLNEGFSLIVASHASLCSDCATKIGDAEMIGGALLDKAKPVDMVFNTFSSILEHIDRNNLEEVNNNITLPYTNPEIPLPLNSYVRKPLDELKWNLLVPGVRQIPLTADSGGKGTVRLFKISPKTTISKHSHNGMELSLILRGSYTDEMGQYGPGDVSDIETTHQPFTAANQECICVIATDAPLIFDGLLSRMVQKFVGIYFFFV